MSEKKIESRKRHAVEGNVKELKKAAKGRGTQKRVGASTGFMDLVKRAAKGIAK
ncbi:MAG: hypothetical protein IK151_02840 [Erysipelotrichaceae bacterium]|nr:hypothetical protein [Erysipelotrichaceae bacterium]